MNNKHSKIKKREYVNGKVSDEKTQKKKRDTQVQVFSVVKIHTAVS
jgi:hypothetical protein